MISERERSRMSLLNKNLCLLFLRSILVPRANHRNVDEEKNFLCYPRRGFSSRGREGQRYVLKPARQMFFGSTGRLMEGRDDYRQNIIHLPD